MVYRVMHRVAIFAATIVLLVGVCAGCTFTVGDDPVDAHAVHDDLAARLAEAQAVQAQALALWDRLIFGEQVSCQDAIPVPPALALSLAEQRVHSKAAGVQEALNRALQALRTSAELWNTECSESREWVPLSIAREGRAAALDASEPLGTAAALLASWE